MKETKLRIEDGYLSEKERKDKFPNIEVQQIRDILEALGFSRHMPIEYASTEVCIKTPKGILMQVRTADKGALGMWGGVLIDGEEPVDGAIREVYEEMGLKLSNSELRFVEVNHHEHTYDNGDKVWFTTYRFMVKLNEMPNITLDEESMGYKIVNVESECEEILSHQKEFIERMINK